MEVLLQGRRAGRLFAKLAMGAMGKHPGTVGGPKLPTVASKAKSQSSLLPGLGGCSATGAQGSGAGVGAGPWAGGDAVTQGSAAGKPEDKGAFPQGSEAAVVPGGKSQGPAEVCWDEALAWDRGSPPAAGTGTHGSGAPAQAEAAGSALGFISERRREAVEQRRVQRDAESGDVPGGPWLPAALPGHETDEAAEREAAKGPFC